MGIIGGFHVDLTSKRPRHQAHGTSRWARIEILMQCPMRERLTETRRQMLIQTASAIGVTSFLGEHSANGAGRSSGLGIVQSVRGPLDVSRLGFTLPHEHLCPSSAGFWQVWPEFFGGREHFVREVVKKLRAARDEGIDTIVDVTPADVGRDIRLLQEVSRKSGMQIIACTGHWLYPSLSMAARSVEELTDFFRLEIERGIEGTAIKPGVIKVATDHEGVTPFIEKCLRAAARTSKSTGVPVTTHTYAADRIGEKQADVFEAEGLDPARVCLGHCDDTNDMNYLTGLAKRGYTIGMDHITWGVTDRNELPAGILTWQQRAQTIKKLIDAGFCNKIFLSHDWYFDTSIARSGTMAAKQKANPDGMLFNRRKTIPYLKQLGIADQEIRTITVENPKHFFARRSV
jgi:phosphotriesterase-related protein